METKTMGTKLSIAAVCAAAAVLLSLFLPFLDLWLVQYSYIDLAREESDAAVWIPVILSVAALGGAGCGIYYGKYGNLGTAATAAVNLILMVYIMNEGDDFVTGADLAAYGYTVFIIGSVAAVLLSLLAAFVPSFLRGETAWSLPAVKKTAGAKRSCSRCGARIPDGVGFCQKCGQKLEIPLTAPAAGKNCQKCGAAVEKGSGYCPKCGSKLETAEHAAPVSRYCPKCGSLMEPGSAICKVCNPIATDTRGSTVRTVTQPKKTGSTFSAMDDDDL